MNIKTISSFALIIYCSQIIPNWWVFKYYQSDIPEKFSSWSYRKEILRKQFAEIDADLLAVQETFPETFEDDFDFLLEDYEGVCHRKSRILPALCFGKEVALYH